MGNLLACFGGKGKSGISNSSRRRPPAKRRSLPCQQQQKQQKQVYGPHEANGHNAALLPAVTKPASPERNAAAADNHGLLLSCVEENEQQQQQPPPLLSGTPDDASSLPVPKQPSFKRSPTAAELAPGSSPKKKVTFDLNVKTYDHVPAADAAEEAEDPERDEVAPLAKEGKGIALRKQEGPEFPGKNRYQNCAESDDEDGLFCDLDEEDADGCYEDSDQEEDGIAGVEEEESFDSYFSLQMDKDRRRDHTSKEVNSDEDISVTSQDNSKSLMTPVAVNRVAPARDRSKYVNSVLNPVENIAQWEDVKAGGRKNVQVKLPPQEKENIRMQEDVGIVAESANSQNSVDSTSPWTPTTATRTTNVASKEGEVSVDTSLSSWLTPTPTPPTTTTAAAAAKASSSNCSFSQQNSYRSNSNSYTSLEERPILGALTVDDIKRTASVSPRKSPTRSPDEMPIMGTVGSYWKHAEMEQEVDSTLATTGSGDAAAAASAKGIPNSTSKYREDKRVNWHSSPFEARLERVLNKGSPAVPYVVF